MLTPLDIQKKEFPVGFRGYKIEQVESFLDDVINDYEKMCNENIELKEKLEVLNEKIEQYQNIEDTLQNTLVVAQRTAEDVSYNAKQKHDNIIKEATEKSKKMIDDANNEVAKIRKEYDNIRKEALMFKAKFKSLLVSQIEAADSYYDLNTLESDINQLR